MNLDILAIISFFLQRIKMWKDYFYIIWAWTCQKSEYSNNIFSSQRCSQCCAFPNNFFHPHPPLPNSLILIRSHIQQMRRNGWRLRMRISHPDYTGCIRSPNNAGWFTHVIMCKFLGRSFSLISFNWSNFQMNSYSGWFFMNCRKLARTFRGIWAVLNCEPKLK